MRLFQAMPAMVSTEHADPSHLQILTSTHAPFLLALSIAVSSETSAIFATMKRQEKVTVTLIMQCRRASQGSRKHPPLLSRRRPRQRSNRRPQRALQTSNSLWRQGRAILICRLGIVTVQPSFLRLRRRPRLINKYWIPRFLSLSKLVLHGRLMLYRRTLQP